MILIILSVILFICPFANGQETVSSQSTQMINELATVYSNLPSAETVLYSIKQGDTLGKIAKLYGTTVELIMKKNRLKNSRIREGRSLVVWIKPFHLKINKQLNQLKVESNGRFIKTYLISTGKAETTTPLGEFEIRTRYPDPIWFHHGDIVPAGSPKNFLGTRWLGFNIPQYGIHGTIYPELIGQSVSGGCIRMKNEDVEELYEIIPIGTKVFVEA